MLAVKKDQNPERPQQASRRGRSVRAAPTRTCVVCRQESTTNKLLRLGIAGTEIIFEAPTAGRGAYVCVARSCLDKLDLKVVRRVFRGAVERFEQRQALRGLHAVAEQRLLETIGLARRQSAMEIGIDRVKDVGAEDSGPGKAGTRICANDLASRGARQVGGAKMFVSGGRIGQAAGVGYVGALRITHPRLSARAAYWWMVWYETTPTESNISDESVAGL